KNLAKQLQGSQLRGIHIPTVEQDMLKSLLRQRAEVSSQFRGIKTQIKSLLLYHGITVPEKYDNPNWTKDFIKWIADIKWEKPTGKLCLDSKLRLYEVIKSEYLQLANELRAYCR